MLDLFSELLVVDGIDWFLVLAFRRVYPTPLYQIKLLSLLAWHLERWYKWLARVPGHFLLVETFL